MANRLNLHASGAETATGTGTAVLNQAMPTWVQLQLDVTNADTAAGDLLDVFVQTRIDSTNWIDVCHFTQFTGTTAAATKISKIHAQNAVAEFDNSTALGAAAVRDLLGTDWRCRWDIVNDTTPTFTFSVDVIMGFA